MHELAARLARGDEAAFVELYDTCADRLHRYVVMHLGSCEAASDVVQSAFLRAVKSRWRFRDVDNPVAYMFQITRNETVRAAKRGRHIRRTVAAGEWFTATDAQCGRIDDGEVAASALARLAAADCELVELKIFGGLTFREIADVTGLPQSTVATRYRRALESLRPWLTKQLR
jgi:RNA polymerase sigma-70 factor (ECF subfamily)